MTINRRSFLAKTALGTVGLGLWKYSNGAFPADTVSEPVVISTWSHGLPANAAAWEILSAGGYALDAVEAGVRISESDPEVMSVGYGSLPDARGRVTLDASIMDELGRAGSVAFLQHIKHPISVARLVMEETPHVMLSGKGALCFALDHGFKRENLRTRDARKAWRKWKREVGEFSAEVNVENQSMENHDTIGMLALDSEGRLCGACTTSGLAYKMHGRVGDSPIIGAGLYVDGEVGGAAATGTGELVMKTLGSFLVVEQMRKGLSPLDACNEAILRITKKIPDFEKHQVGFIALNRKGETGAACLQPGFDYALHTENFSGMKAADSWFKYL